MHKFVIVYFVFIIKEKEISTEHCHKSVAYDDVKSTKQQ